MKIQLQEEYATAAAAARDHRQHHRHHSIKHIGVCIQSDHCACGAENRVPVKTINDRDRPTDRPTDTTTTTTRARVQPMFVCAAAIVRACLYVWLSVCVTPRWLHAYTLRKIRNSRATTTNIRARLLALESPSVMAVQYALARKFC